MTRYTRNAKEVLRDGKHFADCIDDSAARLIADALNERKGMSSAQQSLPLDGADGPLFVESQPRPGDKFTITVEGETYQGEFSKAPIPEIVTMTAEMIEREKMAIQNIGDNRPLSGRATTLHTIRQENDEYACMCGMRWDVAEGEDHP